MIMAMVLTNRILFRTSLESAAAAAAARFRQQHCRNATATVYSDGHAMLPVPSWLHQTGVRAMLFTSSIERQRKWYASHHIELFNATTPSSFLAPVAKKIKRASQAFAAIVIFSVVQGLMVLHKYRHDERGQLQYPDGLTHGKEDCVGDTVDTDEQEDSVVVPSVDGGRRDATYSFSILESLLPYFMSAKGEESSTDSDTALKKGHTPDTIHAIPCSLLNKLKSAKQSATKEPIRVLVIGDSLAVGVGCVEQFVSARNRTSSRILIENYTETDCYRRQGPVFPQALARTLSRHFQLPVQWRSAGVDGGDVDDIRSFCLDVVKQECKQGVDIVIVLFGMNDLKRLIPDNMYRLFSGRQTDVGFLSQFRDGIEMLLLDIRSHAPGAVIVFPELPVQTSIFPLALMMDGLVGVWERMKKIVVKDRRNAMYLELDAKEISDLYSNKKTYSTLEKAMIDDHGLSMIEECDEVVDDNSLLSPDGVHPNKKLYQKWAEIVGRKLCLRIHQQIRSAETNKFKYVH